MAEQSCTLSTFSHNQKKKEAAEENKVGIERKRLKAPLLSFFFF